MFKYISEILSKFTQRQRIVALVILLISIIIISVGPKITESLTYDDKELKLRIESQNTHIIELNQRVNELNTQVINNQRECVNEIVRRETEILEIINEIDGYTRKMKNETRIVNSESRNNYRVISNDTVEVMGMMSPPINKTTIIENKRDEKLIKMITKLKKKVSEDINKTN
jgi:hypothetical protein